MRKFNQAEFESKAKKLVARYLRCELDEKEVFMVWFSKVGVNAKAMLSSVLNDLYFEVTYFGEEEKYIVDVYDLIDCEVHKEDSNGESIDKSPTSGN